MKNVIIFDDAFYIPQLNRERKIWVYLPPGYESSNRHYPVLYMHDGQNLFDDTTSFAGEWGIDEIMNKMFEDGFPGIIIVGIEHGSEERLNEYSPWKHEVMGGGLGDKHVAFVVETLKPAIDKNFRTLPGSEHAGIGGSSMGGLISCYAMLKHPEVFSCGIIFSPAFWFAEESYEFATNSEMNNELRMYFLAGGMEYSDLDVIEATNKMIDILSAKGLSENQYRFIVDPKGKHTEAFWSKYFAEAVRFLFAGSQDEKAGL